ncbi:MAG: MliC family protein [Noviherbaspirillum sp.]
MRNFILILLPGLVLGGCVAMPSLQERRFTVACAGLAFPVAFKDDEVTLYLPDRTAVLPQVRAASGAKFQEGDILLWNKGNEALLEMGDKRYEKCRVEPAR